MKYLYLLLAMCALCLTSCENGDNNNLPPNPVDKKCYKGTMVVDQNDGTFYTQENVEVDYEIKDDKLNFVMYKVKFASGMPLKLDMVVEGVDYEEHDGVYTLSGEGLIPYAMGGPFEKYTITQFTGEITPTKMTMTFMCGEYPIEYHGER